MVILGAVEGIVRNGPLETRGPDPRFDMDRVWQCVAEARGRGWQVFLLNEMLIYGWELRDVEAMQSEIAAAVTELLAGDPQAVGDSDYNKFSKLVEAGEVQTRLGDINGADHTLAEVERAVQDMTPSRDAALLALKTSNTLRLAGQDERADIMLDHMRDIAMQLPRQEVLAGTEEPWETRPIMLFTLAAEEMRLGRINDARQDMDLAERELREVDPSLVPQFQAYRDVLHAVENGMSYEDAIAMIESRTNQPP